jgi:hypothetical protein
MGSAKGLSFSWLYFALVQLTVHFLIAHGSPITEKTDKKNKNSNPGAPAFVRSTRSQNIFQLARITGEGSQGRKNHAPSALSFALRRDRIPIFTRNGATSFFW